MTNTTQRDFMRSLIAKHRHDADRVCKEYALAEERGEVRRKSNKNNTTADEYARALYADGDRRGWFSK